MNGFKGSLEEFWAERERLSEKYETTVVVTGCYLSNYNQHYMCDKCMKREICRRIEED